jgi:hypothetical protein
MQENHEEFVDKIS